MVPKHRNVLAEVEHCYYIVMERKEVWSFSLMDNAYKNKNYFCRSWMQVVELWTKCGVEWMQMDDQDVSAKLKKVLKN